MNTTGKSRLSQFWNYLQHDLIPFLREEDHLALSPALEKVIRVLEFTEIDRFIPTRRGCVGRPPQDRVGPGTGLRRQGGARPADQRGVDRPPLGGSCAAADLVLRAVSNSEKRKSPEVIRA